MAASVEQLKEQFKAAVIALHRNPNPSLKREADEWLRQFSTKHEAWEVCTATLSVTAPANPPEVLFLAAQTLYTKMKLEWHLLSPEQKSSLCNALLSLAQIQAQAAVLLPLVLSRISLALAAAVVRSGPEAARIWPSLLEGFQSFTVLAMELLAAIVEELESAVITQSSRDALDRVLARTAPSAISLITSALTTPSLSPIVAKSALRALRQWVVKGVGSMPQYDAATPFAPALIQRIVQLIADHSVDATDLLASSAEVFQLAVDAMSEIMARCHGSNGPLDIFAVAATVLQFFEQKWRIAVDAGDDGCCLGLARILVAVGTALIDRAADEDFESRGRMTPLTTDTVAMATKAAVLLGLVVDHDDRAEIAPQPFEFFYQLTNWLVQRRRQLYANDAAAAATDDVAAAFAGAFAALVAAVVRRMAYDDDFDGWHGMQDDAAMEEFFRYREDASAALRNAFTALLPWQRGTRAGFTDFIGLVHGQLLGPVLARFAESKGQHGTWQAVESCLYALRAVANQLVDSANERTVAALAEIFDWLSTGACCHGNPALLRTSLLLISDYAAWITTTVPGLTGKLVTLCLADPVVAHMSAVPSAAVAVKALCAASPPAVLPTSLIPVLTGRVDQLVAHDLIPTAEDRAVLLQAAIELLLKSALNDQWPMQLLGVLRPLLARIAAVASVLSTTATSSEAAARALTDQTANTECMVLRAVFRFLHEHPAIITAYGDRGLPLPLTAADWSALAAVARAAAAARDEEVIENMCELFTISVLLSKPANLGANLAIMADAIVAMFASTQAPPALKFVATLNEMLAEHARDIGGSLDDQSMGFVGTLVSQCAEVALPQLLSGQADLELYTAFFEMLNQAMRILAPLMLRSAAENSTFLPSVLQLASRALVDTTGDRDALRSVLSFLSRFVDRQPSPELQEIANRLLAAHGEAMVTSLIVSLAGSAASQRALTHHQAEVLWKLVTNYRSAVVQAWLAAALLRVPASPPLSPDDQHRALRLMFSLSHQQPNETAQHVERRKPRFKAMIADLASVCNGEMTPDVLLAYE